LRAWRGRVRVRPRPPTVPRRPRRRRPSRRRSSASASNPRHPRESPMSDLLHSEEIKQLVRDAYRGIDSGSAAVAESLYSPDELADVPRSATDRALGVANHLRYARLRPGDVVLDVGCGGGIDSILAARRIGPTGRVLALDFLPEMLERTAQAAAEAGLANIEPLEGEMES